MYYSLLKIYKLFWKRHKIVINLHYKCSLNCDICYQKIKPSFVRPKDATVNDAIWWIGYIRNFPVKIREIVLSGGEPGLYPDIHALVNWLLLNDYFVIIQTNLTVIKQFKEIIPSYKLLFVVTYHPMFNKDKFMRNYNDMQEYQITVHELDNDTTGISKVKKSHKEVSHKSNYFRINPDGSIYLDPFLQLEHQNSQYEINNKINKGSGRL